MSKLIHEIAGHREGDTVFLTPEGVRNMNAYGTFKEGKGYILEHDGTHSCPWFIKAPAGNHVYINPEKYLKSAATQEVPQREVVVYKYIVLDMPQLAMEVGMHYEVVSININGSYMVERKCGGMSIVPASKCHPVPSMGTKSVPCRCESFTGVGPQGCPVGPKGAKGDVGISDKGLTAMNKPLPFQALPMTPDTKKAIKKQKEVAREILTFCMIMDHKAFIAGGAPRNWYLNMPANDIDIFLRIPNGASEKHITNVLEAFGVTDMFNLSTHTAPGKRRNQRSESTQALNNHEATSKIEYVLQGNYCGQEVQFIFLEQNTVLNLNYTRQYFDTSINMIAASITPDGALGVDKSLEFNDSMSTGVIFVQENGNPYGDNRHLEKVHNYFPEAPLVAMDYRNIVVKDPRKAYDYNKPWEDFNN